MVGGVVIKSNLITRGAYQALQRVRNLGENPRPLLEEWGGILEASTRNRFDTGKGPGGVPWIPSQRVVKHGGKTLVDKGNMERALRYEVQGSSRLLVGVDGRSESAKNAAAHQFGVNRTVVVVRHLRTIDQAFGVPLRERVTATVRGHARKMHLPARPFLGIDNNDRRDLTESAQSYLSELLQR
jgi:phage gpG-like protein